MSGLLIHLIRPHHNFNLLLYFSSTSPIMLLIQEHALLFKENRLVGYFCAPMPERDSTLVLRMLSREDF